MAVGPPGDVIDFVVRLFGLSSYEAAKKLAYDFGIDPDNPPVAMALKKPYPLARAFRNDEMHCQRVLCDYPAPAGTLEGRVCTANTGGQSRRSLCGGVSYDRVCKLFVGYSHVWQNWSSA